MNKWIFLSFLTLFYGCEDEQAVSKLEDTVRETQPVQDCVTLDSSAPSMQGQLEIKGEASQLNSPEISWSEAYDDCELSHYEIGLGTKPGSVDVSQYQNIGQELNFKYTQLNLDYTQKYYVSVRAVDKKGNISTPKYSKKFSPWDVKSLSHLVLRLDSSDKSSLIDNNNLPGDDANFNQLVSKWLDRSESANQHDFYSTKTSSAPQFDLVYGGLSFANSHLTVADHADLNLGIVSQRTIVTSIRTGINNSGRQVIYEEGGSARGINIYIEDDKLICGFWNIVNDGDGAQAWSSVETEVETEKNYNIVLQFDYSHFQDKNSTEGRVECFVNSQTIGTIDTTSRLHPHSGDIAIGAVKNDSYFGDGAFNGDGMNFSGNIYELIIYNKVHKLDDLQKVMKYFNLKWL